MMLYRSINTGGVNTEENQSTDACDGSQYNADVFVITVDGTPIYYTHDEQEASDYIWHLAKELAVLRYADYNCYVQFTHSRKIKIVGSYNFFIMTYDRVLSTFEITKVGKLKEGGDTEEEAGS